MFASALSRLDILSTEQRVEEVHVPFSSSSELQDTMMQDWSGLSSGQWHPLCCQSLSLLRLPLQAERLLACWNSSTPCMSCMLCSLASVARMSLGLMPDWYEFCREVVF